MNFVLCQALKQHLRELANEWEHTIETMNVLEEVSDDTLIFLQVHKRVWPSTQRDALFWSHMRKVEPEDEDAGNKPTQLCSFSQESSTDSICSVDTWIVCNKSCSHSSSPPNQGGLIRVDLTVCFVCQTVVKKDRNKREDISCRYSTRGHST